MKTRNTIFKFKFRVLMRNPEKAGYLCPITQLIKVGRKIIWGIDECRIFAFIEKFRTCTTTFFVGFALTFLVLLGFTGFRQHQRRTETRALHNPTNAVFGGKIKISATHKSDSLPFFLCCDFLFFFWRFFNGLTLSLSLRRRTPRRKTNGRRDVSFFSAPPLFFLSDDLRGSSVYFSISLIFGHFPNASWPTLREVPGGW